MKRSDIQIGETYRVCFFSQNVACRVISKHFFSLRIRVEYEELGYDRKTYSCSTYKWSWNFIEGY